tara:strand:+ start:10456 stop:10590 length:135 start_codon:yes stop_codon:yes gene_type:complete
VAWTAVEYVPAWQSSQVEEFEVIEKEPAAQGVHIQGPLFAVAVA